MAMANVYDFLGELQGPQIPIEGGVRGRIGDALHQRTVLTFFRPKKTLGVETVENGFRTGRAEKAWFKKSYPTFGGLACFFFFLILDE